MRHVIGLLIVGTLTAACAAQAILPERLATLLGPPDPTAPDHSPPVTSPPVQFDNVSWNGRWNVEFANGVHQIHELRADSTATVNAPAHHWISQGCIEVKGGTITITYVDDRVERWTPVGDRMVVEHWFPASQIPITPPVLGIGERAE